MGLDDLLAPYSYLRGGPVVPDAPATNPMQDMLTQMALGGGMGGGGRAAPSGGGEELIYGGNSYNPSSSDASHGGHLHYAQQRGIVKLGRQLERMGFDVSEHPKFGGVAPVHTTNSHHYSADAIDVNYYGGGRWPTEAKALNWLEHWLGG